MSPRRARWFTALAGAAAAATVASVACLDLTPIIYEAPSPEGGRPPMPDVVVEVAPPPTDASIPDVTQDGDASAPEVVVPPTCVGCITQPDDATAPGCATEIAACMANPECAATYVCAVATGCFQQPSFRDIVNCGIPCAEDAGIVSSNDPPCSSSTTSRSALRAIATASARSATAPPARWGTDAHLRTTCTSPLMVQTVTNL